MVFVRGAPSTVRNFMAALAVPKKGNSTNRTGGSTILKLIRGGNLLYFRGFGDLQPYETWKFRICSESVSGVFPDLFRISLWKCLTVLGAGWYLSPPYARRLASASPSRRQRSAAAPRRRRWLWRAAAPAIASATAAPPAGLFTSDALRS